MNIAIGMHIHILYNLRNEPWGGGNQFLNALRNTWRKMNLYAEQPKGADVILFNSYPFGAEYLFRDAVRLKKQFPNKLLIYRLNGPISAIRQTDIEVDQMIAVFNKAICDGIIFQSSWCQAANKTTFGIRSVNEKVIHNAPDSSLFNREGRAPIPMPGEKIKLIATSWSSNWRKGFDIYRFLDENLDWNRYEMTFVGNTPIAFNRIRTIAPIGSEKMSQLLKTHDLFITASQADPCSNSLVEALACGLPAVVRNDGGHPELIKNGGVTFDGVQDVIQAIDRVAKNLEHFKRLIPTYRIETTAAEYAAFGEQVAHRVARGEYHPKRVETKTFAYLVWLYLLGLAWLLRRGLKKIRNNLLSKRT